MRESKEPLRIRGTYVGSYDSMTCPVCKYFYFTDKEYDLAISDARSLGLIGPSIPDVSLIVTFERLQIGPVLHFSKSTNSNAKLKKKKGQIELEEAPSLSDAQVVFPSLNIDYERLASITTETGK
jgi:hypothetical protein